MDHVVDEEPYAELPYALDCPELPEGDVKQRQVGAKRDVDGEPAVVPTSLRAPQLHRELVLEQGLLALKRAKFARGADDLGREAPGNAALPRRKLLKSHSPRRRAIFAIRLPLRNRLVNLKQVRVEHLAHFCRVGPRLCRGNMVCGLYGDSRDL